MRVITLDFETYYDSEYSLSKITTEAYIRHPLFQTIGFGYRIDDEGPQWVSGSDDFITMALHALDIPNSYLVCHNMAFDGAILAWRYGIRPKYYFDTLSMARPITGQTVGGSLAKLAQRFGLGEKGNEVVAALGKRRENFTPAELHQYGEYCKNDVVLTSLLFKILKQYNPNRELFIQDLMLRMFIDPVLEFDKEVLQEHLSNVQAKKAQLMARIDASIGRDALMSNDKLAAVLRQLGVTPPTKISVKTKKETYAFGKTDPGFKELLDHHNPAVQAVVAARLGIKSTLEETRTESFLGIAERGALPILLNYWGAHTGRASGGDKINLQNLPRGGALRRSMLAPAGHSLVAVDSAQIEARVVAWLAGQDDLVEDFRNGVDIYSKFASDVYGRPVNRKRKETGPDGKDVFPDFVPGFVGKTCLTADTRVVTNRGIISLAEVSNFDLLWDGESWVPHAGVIYNGVKSVISHAGLSATRDHEIQTEHGWQEWGAVSTHPTLFQSALRSANLPCFGMSAASAPVGTASGTTQYANAHAVGKVLSIEAISELADQPGVTPARKSLRAPSDTGSTKTPCPTIRTGLGCLTGSLLRLFGATRQTVKHTSTMGSEAYQSPESGATTEPRFFATFRHWMAGTARSLKWTGLTSTETMHPGTSGLSHAAQIWRTNDESRTSSSESETLKPVFDIMNAGPRHRFAVLTDAGPVIVHNCILGLGFGMGPDKFKATLKAGQSGVSVDMPLDEARSTVNLYRSKYPAIKQLWDAAQYCLDQACKGYETEIGVGIKLRFTPEGIHLPNGTMIRYPNLRWNPEDREYLYDGRYGPVKIYGGKCVENIVQALARIIVFDQMAKIEQQLRPKDKESERYRIVLTVHDEVVACVPDHAAQETQDMMERIMKEVPRWATGLPISCEGAIGKSYGDAK